MCFAKRDKRQGAWLPARRPWVYINGTPTPGEWCFILALTLFFLVCQVLIHAAEERRASQTQEITQRLANED